MSGDLLYLMFNSWVISLVSFGGGAQALFYQSLVVQRPLLTRDDLSAILAFGYATPGPIAFTISTFAGYHIYGLPGALLATLAIFVMPCLLAILTSRYLGHWLDKKHAGMFVKSVGLAAAGVIAATAIGVMQGRSLEPWHILIVIASFTIMTRWKKTNPLIILAAGGVIGLLVG